MGGIWLLLLISSVVNSAVLSEHVEGLGKKCVLKTTGEPGFCINVDHCDHAKNLLSSKKWKRPQECGNFIGIYPLVCCPAPRSQVACQVYHPPEDICVTSQIAGGEVSKGKEFPHMAALGYGERESVRWYCGGSLISGQFVLTAAHCIRSKNYGFVRHVRLGDLDLADSVDENNFDAQPQDFSVMERHVHPEYKSRYRYHDIALLRLDRTARFSSYVRPACLHWESPVPHELIVTGWGKIDLLGPSSSKLLHANIFYVNHTTCAARYSGGNKKLPSGISNDIQVCAGHPEGKDTCPGDSGGPLHYKVFGDETHDKHYRIVGVTSLGIGCGVGNTIAVYTRVSGYRKWIEDIVWPAQNFSITMIS